MSHQVLARKWRPQTFKQLVGQEPILRMLTHALEQNRVHHAYLFSGTRGVGKTTLARILAKCLNCEQGVTATPCSTCATCLSIDGGQFLDLYEIDAASRTKVEDTRELLDNVLYQPTQGRYKIYLIDEVHMLSNHSFNALLKTLEEPPSYVKFLLATTEPKRLPITILSRCLQFHLKRIPKDQIAAHLQYISETEQVNFEPQAISQLATAADGSLRDALSLLDQAIAYGNGKIESKHVSQMLGSLAEEDLSPLIHALIANDANDVFQTIQGLSHRGADFAQVLELFISLLHQAAILQLVPARTSDNALVTALAKHFSAEDIQLYYQILLFGRRDLPFSPTPEMGFEMTLLRLIAFTPAQHAATAPVKETIATKVTPEKNITPVAINPAESLPNWRDILPKLELTGMAYALAGNCMVSVWTEQKIELTISTAHQPMLNAKLKERIAEALCRYTKRAIQLDITTTRDVIQTPVREQNVERDNKLNATKENLLAKPNIKRLIEMYDATLEVNAV